MKIAILTIFPEIFSSFLDTSLISKAIEKRFLEVQLFNIREFSDPPHYQVDDTPYGGGAGMVMKPEPISRAIEKAKESLPDAKVVLLSASGCLFTQAAATDISKLDEIIFICTRYEGIDQRIIDKYVDHELSIGNYVMMGGEVAAMVVIEATSRLIPNIIGNQESLGEESFSISDEEGLLVEGPQYTRPAEFAGIAVPEVLTSGDHKKIANWRKEKAIERRAKNRPDLLRK